MWTLPRTVLVLDVHLQDQSVGRYGFTKRVVVVGRGPRCDLQLDHPGISRTHFRIHREGPVFVVLDALSANGTFVNRHRIASQALHEGDEIEAGKYLVRVSLRAPCEYDGADPERELELAALQMPTVRAPHLKADAAYKSGSD